MCWNGKKAKTIHQGRAMIEVHAQQKRVRHVRVSRTL